jgi:hypothetical protein
MSTEQCSVAHAQLHAPSTSTDVTDVRTNEESGSVLRLILRKQRAQESQGISFVGGRQNTARYAAAS